MCRRNSKRLFQTGRFRKILVWCQVSSTKNVPIAGSLGAQ